MTALHLSRRELIAASALVAATPAWAAAPDEDARLNAFFESVFARDLARNPAAQSVRFKDTSFIAQPATIERLDAIRRDSNLPPLKFF